VLACVVAEGRGLFEVGEDLGVGSDVGGGGDDVSGDVHGSVVVKVEAAAGNWVTGARFEAPAASIAQFLAMTFRLVPDGAEPAPSDIDAGIAGILAEGGPQ
jgi:hypothetical protein